MGCKSSVETTTAPVASFGAPPMREHFASTVPWTISVPLGQVTYWATRRGVRLRRCRALHSPLSSAS